ncbi:ATP-dependent DNA ligase LigD phosphoesterase module /ATP-dependent DNA ligase LigD polymerase module [Arboricoccus pini]|uniref:DNA ligase (ATP) n=1 Tax=Arboricoccus pini TaxID=1963835 RepID=A0A212QQ88_9PROT|nr:DNA ligase D [Arboricoccus pini]SNB61655.1 ATP-dependent DNA ligase LigD phosphoesterase module /ATP-dependent DNA ligase LigD polymerase module [Arboricoccus pini]
MAAGARVDDRLAIYRQKRRFQSTPEPDGGQAVARPGLYVIQKHDATRLHYDFRLELDGVLKSWAVTRGPSLDPGEKRLAVETEDHPLDYGDFEGTIPKGNYGAGTVMVWDIGKWRPLGDAAAGLKDGMLKFELQGERLKGRWVLVLMKGKSDAKRKNWLLIKERDQVADPLRDVVEEFTQSALSGRDFAAIAAASPPAGGRAVKPDTPSKSRSATQTKTAPRRRQKALGLPTFEPPALATLVDRVPEGEDWLYEIKFDGYRALVACAGQDVRILTRSGLDWTARFPRLANAIGAMGLESALIDGEIVAVRADGGTDFSRLVATLKAGDDAGLSYFAFDLLRVAGEDLRSLPLIERKERLKGLLGDTARTGPIFYTDHLRQGGARMLETLCQKGFEGIVAKAIDAPYRAGRSKSWLKVKCGKDQEFVIVGYRPSDKQPFASLLLATREAKQLRYAGRVGSGFDARDFEDLGRRFVELARANPAMDLKVPAAIRRDARWIEPQLVAAIAFAGFTGEGIIRHGRFKGLRLDKPAKEVVLEEPLELEAAAAPVPKPATSVAGEVAGVRLTHPGRMLYARQKITKLDVARYYAAVASFMLPHVKGRLASLVRCPEGPTKACFFQKHKGSGLPAAFKSVAVPESDGGTGEYLYIDGAKGLVSLAQIGALEFHVWGARAADYEHPDRLVFDLDPDPSLTFADVKEGALEVRALLAGLGLKSFPMLSGGKGIHVVLPIRPEHGWTQVSAFCKGVAQNLAKTSPDRYVANMSKAKRKGRIFIDYLRNQRGSTAIAPYSTRAREGAPIAWPVSWDELSQIDRANLVTLQEAMRRLSELGDPWAGYARLRQGLKPKALATMGVEKS